MNGLNNLKRYEMKNIHILPTDKPSRLIIYSTLLNEFRLLDEPIEDWKHKKNIYITNDEEIKEGDWIYGLFNGGVVIKSEFDIPKNSQYHKEYGLKIILTTDPDLIKDGVQAIDDEFLEWFVKNPSCKEVEVEWVKTPDGIFYHQDNVPYGCYKIIIPKEEPKQEIDMSKYTIGIDPYDKQETLEEETLAKIKFVLLANNDTQAIRLLEQYGKWMQEQNKNKYSEEDMKEAIAESWNSCLDNEDGETFTQCFNRIIQSLQQTSWNVEVNKSNN